MSGQDSAGRGVLLTRPEPGATATACRVAALGYVPVLAPLFTIAPLPTPLPAAGTVQAVLVTSGNALAALTAFRHLPLLAVGDATAARARAGGFAHAASAAGDSRALARLAAERLHPAAGPLLLACQQGRGEALAAALGAAGFTVERREVYAALPLARLPATAVAALADGSLRAAPFFSTETARLFVRLAGGVAAARFAGVEALAIAPSAAAALASLRWRCIRVAAAPTEEAVLGLLR